MIDIVNGGDYYFRQYLNQPMTGGNSTARLRRLTKEISTLSGQLPVDWDSSILLAVDTNRMDALRAVIFPPSDTPYANGAFFFDIFLPPEYPNKPPMVQFMTTGGGKIRFNPNLYNDGKVCLSLLGTWSGPSWDPGKSTLLQVLVSIQAMILGEKQPYGNEPGWERQLHTSQGKKQSAQYNRTQQYNTTQYSILPALKGQMPRGFEEAVKLHFKLKAEEVKMQVRLWSREHAAEAAASASAQQQKQKRGSGLHYAVPYWQGGYPPGNNSNSVEKYAKAMKEAASAVITALDGL